MKTATLRQLRHNFSSVFAWVEQREPVSISQRRKIIALGPAAYRPRRHRRSDGGGGPETRGAASLAGWRGVATG